MNTIGDTWGSAFADAYQRWATIENEHDKMHPDRDECGGVGGCSMMTAAHVLEVEMVDALNEWRRS